MTYTGLSAKIAEYIEVRSKDKLEDFDKEAAKKRQAAKNEVELAELNQDLAEERWREQQRFSPANWLDDAARRASQIQLVTHALKFTHSDAKGTSLYAPGNRSECPLLPEGAVVSTASLSSATIDVVGNAAALDVGKLLQLEVGKYSLMEAIRQHDDSPLAPFAKSSKQLRQWMEGFRQVLEDKAPSSHKLTKQLFFPIGKREYHLLAPLYASSFSEAIHNRITNSRFSDKAKAAREARRKSQPSDTVLVEYPNTAVQKFGGTKPQNISQLNSGRGGKAFLLSCAPPKWRSQARPLLNIKNVIDGPYSYRVRRETRDLQQFLLSQVGKNSTLEVRTKERAPRVDHLIDELMQFGAEIQYYHPAGWSASEECLLPQCQRLWLDPGRKLQDESFAQEREKNDWIQQVADDFATWLNRKLKHKSLAMGEVEHREWKSLVTRKLRLLREYLGAV
jgi:CRISPR-associated protein Csy1